jgi:hypothetical protein
MTSSSPEVNVSFISTGKLLGSKRGMGDELETIAKSSTKLYGAVAYFTLNHIKPEMKKVLRNGWLCVDIHEPTWIDKVDKFSSDIEFHFYLKKLTHGRMKGHTGLMHSKLLLFVSKSTATIVIGSHNWTEWATSSPGVNNEDSVKIEVPIGHDLHLECMRRLEKIKANCVRYDHSKKRYFKIVQKAEMKRGTFTLSFTRIGGGTIRNEKIVLFGDDIKEYEKKIPRNRDDELLVTIHDKSDTNDFDIYEGTVLRIGYLPGKDSDLPPEEFDEIYHALKIKGAKKSVLDGKSKPPKNYNSQKYFICFSIGEPEPDYWRLFIPRSVTAEWEDYDEFDFTNDPLFFENTKQKFKAKSANIEKTYENDDKSDEAVPGKDVTSFEKYDYRE